MSDSELQSQYSKLKKDKELDSISESKLLQVKFSEVKVGDSFYKTPYREASQLFKKELLNNKVVARRGKTAEVIGSENFVYIIPNVNEEEVLRKKKTQIEIP